MEKNYQKILSLHSPNPCIPILRIYPKMYPKETVSQKHKGVFTKRFIIALFNRNNFL